jgi:hypothetical protein
VAPSVWARLTCLGEAGADPLGAGPLEHVAAEPVKIYDVIVDFHAWSIRWFHG